MPAGEIAVTAFGGYELLGPALDVGVIRGDGGTQRDTLIVDADVAVRAELSGGDGDDVLTGGARGDLLRGGEGRDTLTGNGGADTLLGGAGNDILLGGAGGDTLDGGADTDLADYSDAGAGVIIVADQTSGGTRLTGAAAAAGDVLLNIEKIEGSAFDDKITGFLTTSNQIDGGAGNDTLQGGDVTDLVIGGAGADILRGGTGAVDDIDDRTTYAFSEAAVVIDLVAGTGLGGDAEGDVLDGIEHVQLSFFDDSFVGDDAANEVEGFDGNDRIEGRGGDDTLEGQGGADTLVSTAGDDDIDGGADDDLLIWNRDAAAVAITVDIDETGRGSFSGERSLVRNVEAFDLATGAGDDEIATAAGDDRISTGAGDDVVNGRGGADVIELGAGDDTAISEDPVPEVEYRVDTVRDASGRFVRYDDYITIGGERSRISKVPADVISGGEGSDTLIYSRLGISQDISVIARSSGLTTFFLVYDQDDLVDPPEPPPGRTIPSFSWRVGELQASKIERFDLALGAGDDTAWLDAGDDIVRGGAGDDNINGGAGDDLLEGGTGDDLLNTGTFNAGPNGDVVRGGAGADRLELFSRVAEASGGAGDDTFYLASGLAVDRGRFVGTIDGGAGVNVLEAGFGNIAAAELLNVDRTELTGAFSNRKLLLRADQAADLGALSFANANYGYSFEFESAGAASFGDTVLAERNHIEILAHEGGNQVTFGAGSTGPAGSRNLVFSGGAGDDAITAFDAAALVARGGGGADTLTGAAGDDDLRGDAGDDIVRGGAGDDNINGGAGDDLLEGGTGDDLLNTGTFNAGPNGDVVRGGAGADRLELFSRVAEASGGAGDDTFYLASGLAVDRGRFVGTIDGGAGVNVLEAGFGNIAAAELLNVDRTELTGAFSNRKLLLRADQAADLGALSFANANYGYSFEFESAGAASFGDTVLAERNHIEILAHEGGNQVTFGAGSTGPAGSRNLVFSGGAGDDAITAFDAAALVARGGGGADTLTGAAGDDDLRGDAGDDIVRGGAGDDNINGGAGDDLLEGGAGDDLLNTGTFNAGPNGDVVRGGAGADRLELFSRVAEASGGAGDDTFYLASGLAVDRGRFVGTIDGGAGVNVLEAGFGNIAAAELLNVDRTELTGAFSNRKLLLRADQAADLGALSFANANYGYSFEFESAGAASFGDTVLAERNHIEILAHEGGNQVTFGAGSTGPAGSRNLVFSGGAGDDAITAFDAAALVARGGGGADTLTGAAGDDDLRGDAGDDIVRGGAGDDNINGGAGDDLLEGGTGDDLLNTGTFNAGPNGDVVRGGAGADRLELFSRVAEASGGAGDDTFYLASGLAVDRGRFVGTIDGGAGVNVLEAGFGNIAAAELLNVDRTELTGAFSNRKLLLRADQAADLGALSFANANYGYSFEFESAGAASFGDTVLAERNHIEILAHEGGNQVTFGAGSTGPAGSRNLIFSGGAGDDAITAFDAAALVARGGGGADTLTGAAGDDDLRGDAGDDVLSGNEGDDTLRGGAGADLFLYGRGDNRDRIADYQSGVDTLRLDGSLGLANVGAALARATEFDGDVLFDFGAGDVLTVANTTKLALAGGLAVGAAANAAPEAVNDTASVAEGGTVLIDVLGNDSDPDGDTLAIASVEPASNGAVAVEAGRVRYTPDADFSGADEFSYVVADGTVSSTATVTVSVDARPDDTVANDDAYAVDEDAQLVVAAQDGVLSNDADADGPLAQGVILVEGPSSGTLSLAADGGFTYAPDADVFGTDTFTYETGDGFGKPGRATVTLRVNPVADRPVATADTAVTAFGATLAVQAAGVLANDLDPDGDALSAELVTDVANGTLVLGSDGSYTYVPDAGFAGTDAFVYRALDATGLTSDPVAVTIAVGDTLNRSPAPLDDAFTVLEDAGAALVGDLLANDGDPDGDALAVTTLVASDGTLIAVGVATALPEGGMITVSSDGGVVFDPAGAFEALPSNPPPEPPAGTVTIAYSVSDGSLEASAEAIIGVRGSNDAPVAGDDAGAGFETDEDTAFVTATVLANDVDPDAGDQSIVARFDMTGTLGTVSDLGNGTFGYDPGDLFQSLAAGEVAFDSFGYTVDDGQGAADVATVTIRIAGANDAPQAVADAYATTAGQRLVVAADAGLLANDGDVDGDALSVLAGPVAGPSNGTVTLSTDGAFAYLPDAGFAGTDLFTYSISDGEGGTDTATAEITVAGIAGPALVLGTEGNDRLVGSDGADLIRSLGGRRDLLTGGAGEDVFDFAAATANGARETRIVTDFEAGEGVRIGTASVVETLVSSDSLYLILDGDGDVIRLVGVVDPGDVIFG